MENAIERAASLYTENYRILKKALYWKTSSSLYIKLCALTYSLEGNHASVDNLLDAIQIIKKNTGWSSYFRNAKVYTAAFLAAHNRSFENAFAELQDCYDTLHQVGFWRSSYLVYAAYALYASTPRNNYAITAEKAKLIYQLMKKEHPFLTSSDDYSTAVMMASINRDPEDLMREVEASYKALKKGGLQVSNGLQFLSHLLLYDPSPVDQKVQKCLQIAQMMRDMKFRITSMYYGTIGFLALTMDNWQNAVADTLQVVQLLKEEKCFPGYEKELNTMFSAALICKTYLDISPLDQTTLLKLGVCTTIQAIIAAQAAACAAAASASAAAAASAT